MGPIWVIKEFPWRSFSSFGALFGTVIPLVVYDAPEFNKVPRWRRHGAYSSKLRLRASESRTRTLEPEELCRRQCCDATRLLPKALTCSESALRWKTCSFQDNRPGGRMGSIMIIATRRYPLSRSTPNIRKCQFNDSKPGEGLMQVGLNRGL